MNKKNYICFDQWGSCIVNLSITNLPGKTDEELNPVHTVFWRFFLPWVVWSGIEHVGTRRSLTDHITLPASASLSCFRCHGERKKGPSSAVILISLPEVSASLTDSERNASVRGFLAGSLQGQICVYVCTYGSGGKRETGLEALIQHKHVAWGLNTSSLGDSHDYVM